MEVRGDARTRRRRQRETGPARPDWEAVFFNPDLFRGWDEAPRGPGDTRPRLPFGGALAFVSKASREGAMRRAGVPARYGIIRLSEFLCGEVDRFEELPDPLAGDEESRKLMEWALDHGMDNHADALWRAYVTGRTGAAAVLLERGHQIEDKLDLRYLAELGVGGRVTVTWILAHRWPRGMLFDAIQEHGFVGNVEMMRALDDALHGAIVSLRFPFVFAKAGDLQRLERHAKYWDFFCHGAIAPDQEIMRGAAAGGQEKVFDWARNRFKWTDWKEDADMTEKAAANNQLPFLRRFVDELKGHQGNAFSIARGAAENGNREMYDWLQGTRRYRESGGLGDREVLQLCEVAMRAGHPDFAFHVLRKHAAARQPPAPMPMVLQLEVSLSDKAAALADDGAAAGALRVLREEFAAPRDENTAQAAVMAGNAEALRYLLRTGCPVNRKRLYDEVLRGDDPAVMDAAWDVFLPGPQSEERLTLVALDAALECAACTLRWLVTERGAPLSSEIIKEAFLKRPLVYDPTLRARRAAVIAWAVGAGCPLPPDAWEWARCLKTLLLLRPPNPRGARSMRSNAAARERLAAWKAQVAWRAIAERDIEALTRVYEDDDGTGVPCRLGDLDNAAATAAIEGDEKSLSVLLKHEKCGRRFWTTVTMEAARGGHLRLLRWAIANVAPSERRPVLESAKQAVDGNINPDVLSRVRASLEGGADV